MLEEQVAELKEDYRLLQEALQSKNQSSANTWIYEVTWPWAITENTTNSTNTTVSTILLKDETQNRNQ